MPDQATDLRELMRRSASCQRRVTAVPRRIVVFGGKGGVGTTTISVKVAEVLARQGARTILLETAGGDAALLCGIEPVYTTAEVLGGKRTVAEALYPGPGNLRILAGSLAPGQQGEDSVGGWQRLIAQLAELVPPAQIVIQDAGSRPDGRARRFWEAADGLLLVTTPETAAVMETYASIKVLAERGKTAPMHLVVNLASDAPAAEDVYRRLSQACRRFLAMPLALAGHIPPGVPAALATSRALSDLARVIREQCLRELKNAS